MCILAVVAVPLARFGFRAIFSTVSRDIVPTVTFAANFKDEK